MAIMEVAAVQTITNNSSFEVFGNQENCSVKLLSFVMNNEKFIPSSSDPFTDHAVGDKATFEGEISIFKS